MGAIKTEKAKEADQALIDAPSNAVATRTRLLNEIEAMRELMMDPDEDGYKYTTGRALMHPGSNYAGNLHDTGKRLGQLNCIFKGYDPDQVLHYELGTFQDFQDAPDVYASTVEQLTVMVVSLDGTEEVPMSNVVGSFHMVGANQVSNYIGDYYLVQNYDTHELYNIDDDVGVYVSPAPYIPQNVINGEIAVKPEDGDYLAPTDASDTRFDFRISNNGVTVTDIYEPELIHNIKVNSVSNDVSFIVSETLLSGDKTMELDTLSTVNTTTMSVDIVCTNQIERGNTGFDVSDKVQGLSSGAFGYVGSVNTSFRWTMTQNSVILTDNLVSTIEGFEQDALSQKYGTMNLVSYTAANGDSFPARITLHHQLREGVANTRDGQVYVSPSANMATLAPPAFGKTLPLRRWRDHDDDNPAHTTGLLAIITARGLQMNLDWFVANNRHEGGQDPKLITKLNNDEFVPYIGWAANTDYDIVKASRPSEYQSSAANNGSGGIQYSTSRSTIRPSENYPNIEANPFSPASVNDMPADSAPYQGTYVHWDDSYYSGAGSIAYAVHSELRWRYQPNPFLLDYDRNDAGNPVYNPAQLPGYYSGHAPAVNKQLDIETIRDMEAPDAMKAGFARLTGQEYDGYSSNTGGFRWNTDGDVPTGASASLAWTTPGTNTYSVPAWTRDAIAGGGSPTGGAGVSFPMPDGNGNFNTYNGLIANQANTTSPSYPFSSGTHYEPGTYYIKQNNQYGPRIYKLTGTYVQNTTVHTVAANVFLGISGSTTTYYNHHIVFNAEEYQSEVNLLGRVFDSNDFYAFVDIMKQRMISIHSYQSTPSPGVTKYHTYADGNWDLYFGNTTGQSLGYSNNKPGLVTYTTGNNAGNQAIDRDSATWDLVLDNIEVCREFRNEYLAQMNSFTNSNSEKNGFTFNFTYDTNTLYLAIKNTADALIQWKATFEERMGYPSANQDAGGHGISNGSGCSKELWEFIDVLVGDTIGPLKKASNAILNLDLLYDDVVRNRKKYRVFSS